jgi:LemA protein
MLSVLLNLLLGFAILAPVLWIVGVFNHMVRLRANVAKDFGNIDVLLRQRFAEIPSLAEVCKGYAAHEARTLEDVTRLRTQYRTGMALGPRLLLENQIVQVMGTFRGVAEAYPDLHADELFRELQTRITDIENQISDRRELFNQTVTNFNTFVSEFPANLFARRFGFETYPVLEAPEASRDCPRVSAAPSTTTAGVEV